MSERLPTLTGRASLETLRRMNHKLTDLEFNAFIEQCRVTGLNPFADQICPIVFNEGEANKRQMRIIVKIGGYRSLVQRAAREGGFIARPDHELPRLTYDEAAKDATNRLGLVSAEVTLYTSYDQGKTWFAVTGLARWSERAPVLRDRNGEPYFPPGMVAWIQQPEHMLAKCAEADASRKISPDILGGTYAAEEADRMMIDITPAEIVGGAEPDAAAPAGEKPAKPGKIEVCVSVQWERGIGQEEVPIGQFADRVLAHIQAQTDPGELRGFWETNIRARRIFYDHSKRDAFELKRAYEARIKDLETPPPASNPERDPDDLFSGVNWIR